MLVRDEIKHNFILLTFCFLLWETLTSATLYFAFLGIVLSISKIKINLLLRNTLALIVFGSYWITYGKIIDPEIGLNFLTTIVVLKILERESKRDHYMIFFGMMLLISAGSLFEKTLTYLFFFLLSFWILLREFYSFLDIKWSWSDFFKSLIWPVILASLLFLLAPRLLSPIPFDQAPLGKGEVGYTSDLNISEIESLEPNSSNAFEVSASSKLLQKDLYWRGNTLSYNDGWNWKEMVQDKKSARPINQIISLEADISLKYRLSTRSNYFFTLDKPRLILFEDKAFEMDPHLKTLTQRRWDWVARYESIGSMEEYIREQAPHDHYLKVPLPRKEKDKIQKMFTGKNLKELELELKKLFQASGFSYTFSPGKIEDLTTFLEKKKGFCSHYASATAIILRIKGTPTRLVSGFMGGQYNPYAHYYTITQNDAHVWVEAWEEGQWKKIDPTEWIAPERVELGGMVFMERLSADKSKNMTMIPFITQLYEIKLWFNQWDFKFYQWLENIDYKTQERWFKFFNIKRQWLFTMIPLIIVIFMVFYLIFLNFNRTNTIEDTRFLWRLYLKKMKLKGLDLSPLTLDISYDLKDKDEAAYQIWVDLMAASFQSKKTSLIELKKRIQKL